MSINVKQALVFLSPLPWQCPCTPAGGISCPSPCTVILTGAGTDLLTLSPKVGREVSFFIFTGTLQLSRCCLFYQRDAVVSLPSSAWAWRGETREVLWVFALA